MNCSRLDKVQAAFPTVVPTDKGRQKEPRPQKEWYEVVPEGCKAELIPLCEQYRVEQGWRPPSDVVYKKAHKLASCKVDNSSANVRGVEDLSSGDESDN